MHLGDDKVQCLPKQSMSKALIQDNAITINDNILTFASQLAQVLGNGTQL
jgi:hypothetical protein